MEHNPSAFPVADERDFYGQGIKEGSSGMSLRDWFAGQVLEDCLSFKFGNDWGKEGIRHIPLAAERAYRIADAMLAERAKEATDA